MSDGAKINVIKTGFYLDSVALMRVSADISGLDGVVEAALMIGSQSNREIMRGAGLLDDSGERAGPNDLVIAVRAVDADTAVLAVQEAEAALERRLSGSQHAASEFRPRNLLSALEQLPEANLALISVPGEFAAREAQLALKHGLNVMMFSDNVSLEQELRLKTLAREQGLIVMGPDCGTAFIHGVPLAFANVIPRGSVGVVAASGTGLQEFAVLLARAGGGLSHGIGVGGRDLNDAIGGISTLIALDWLEDDSTTETIVLISKPPGTATRNAVLDRLRQSQKPIIVCFIGDAEEPESGHQLRTATTLREAAELATGTTIGGHFVADFDPHADPSRRYLRGLFTGGTLCAEAQVIMRAAGLELASNAPIPGVASNIGVGGHWLLDLGADEYTAGRPHPMIEPAVRTPLLAAALADSDVAVILLDLVLGHGAHPNPADSVVKSLLAGGADRPAVIASVCGAADDPQGFAAQVHALESAGVIVAPSNAHAAELAVNVVLRR